MEAIIIIILLGVGWAIFTTIFSAGVKTIGAAGKAVTGNGSFSENMDLAFKGMESFDVQIIDGTLNDDGTGPAVKELQGKGLFPITTTKNIGFVTSVFDNTSGEYEPVICVIDIFQEENSSIYQFKRELGEIESGQGFVRWVSLGYVIPEILEPPYSGTRKMEALIRMVDLDDMPEITHGFHMQETTGILWQKALEFDYTFEEKGYQEASEHRDEAVSISLKIGMAVAMSDGSLDDAEGDVLKNWIIKSIAPFTEDKQKHLKDLYNEAMRDSYEEAKNGLLSLSALTERLNEIGEKSSKYETVELCFEIMAADGVADEAELNVIRKISEALNLDMDEVSKMRDKNIINLDSSVSEQASIEVMLGIESDWSQDKVKSYLRSEFQKWNDRLNTLPEGDERSNAQLMLHRIAEARKKYV